MNNDERLICNRFLDAANMCYSRNIPIATDFLDINKQTLFQSIIKDLPPVSYIALGGYELAERKVIQFLPFEDFPYENPYSIIKIAALNGKFSDELSHRDYLGTILGLGISRDKTGDILVMDNEAYVFCCNNIADYLVENLTRIKHTTVYSTIISSIDFKYEPKYDTITGTVASLRLDSVISLGFQGSRSHLISYIEDGKVSVNGRIITSNAYHLNENDIISVRGLGRIQYVRYIADTKKGRAMIEINKYTH